MISSTAFDCPVAICIPACRNCACREVLAPNVRVFHLGRGVEGNGCVRVVGRNNNDFCCKRAVGLCHGSEGYVEGLAFACSDVGKLGGSNSKLLFVGIDVDGQQACACIGHGVGLACGSCHYAEVGILSRSNCQLRSIGSLVCAGHVDDEVAFGGRNGNGGIGSTFAASNVCAGNHKVEGNSCACCPVGAVGSCAFACNGYVCDFDSTCTCVGEVIGDGSIGSAFAEVEGSGRAYDSSVQCYRKHGSVGQACNLVNDNVVADEAKFVDCCRNVRKNECSKVGICQTIAASNLLVVSCPCCAIVVRALYCDVVSSVAVCTLCLDDKQVAILEDEFRSGQVCTAALACSGTAGECPTCVSPVSGQLVIVEVNDHEAFGQNDAGHGELHVSHACGADGDVAA